MGALGAFGRSRAPRIEGAQTKVTFNDVAGIDEAKAELTEVVDFLKNPGPLPQARRADPARRAARGPPGHRQDAARPRGRGRGGVPFFSDLRVEFVEAIVGIGAAPRARPLQAGQGSPPAIIFIDELDAIGRSRSAGRLGFGGNDEREQTLNQILTEMDGFESGAAVIVLGATNRPEVLDAGAAAARPLRPPRHGPAARQGRPRKILEVHTRSLPLADDVDLDRLASTTRAWSAPTSRTSPTRRRCWPPAAATRRSEQADFTDALEKIVLGAPRGLVLSDEDKRRTAYHESGHALVGMLTPGADPVRKVSIIPRTMSLGVTISAPDVERTNYDEEYLITRIKVALGGRVAEEVVYDSISAGAESDIQQLTAIARQMVGRWGMSPAIGPIAVLPARRRAAAAAGRVRGLRDHAASWSTRRSGGSSTRRTARCRSC